MGGGGGGEFAIFIVFFVSPSECWNNIVTYLLIVKTVEPKKQPLPENGSETTIVSRQRLGNTFPLQRIRMQQ
jgi:hypothetical protein